jgi:soluble lytic murein transglycosylase-like protein
MALKLLWTALFAAAWLAAGEFAVLSTGFHLYADRHEIDGSTVRLYSRDGITEFSASMVVAFEPAPEAAPVTAPPSVDPKPSPDVNQLIAEAAKRNGLDAPDALRFLHSVAKVESGYRVDAVSPKGAVGLMQLMPATARTLGADPHDPEQNADAGARYLRELLLKYRGNTRLALAAYNAGPGAVERHNGVPPYRETVQYIEKVLRQFNRRQE